MLLEGHLQVSKGLHLVHEGHELRVVLGVKQVVFEHGKLVGVGQGVVFAVFFLQEGVNLSGGEFVGVAALDLSDDGVARLDALTVGLTDQVAADDVLCHRHGALAGVERGEVQLAGLEGLGEGEQPAVLHDELGHRVVATGEFAQRDGFAALQALQHGVVAHELTEVDVVALVNGRKGGGDDDVDASPTLALGGRFSA